MPQSRRENAWHHRPVDLGRDTGQCAVTCGDAARLGRVTWFLPAPRPRPTRCRPYENGREVSMRELLMSSSFMTISPDTMCRSSPRIPSNQAIYLRRRPMRMTSSCPRWNRSRLAKPEQREQAEQHLDRTMDGRRRTNPIPAPPGGRSSRRGGLGLKSRRFWHLGSAALPPARSGEPACGAERHQGQGRGRDGHGVAVQRVKDRVARLEEAGHPEQDDQLGSGTAD